jgi:hypothetical protein
MENRHKGYLIKFERTINGKVYKMNDKQKRLLHNYLLSRGLHWFWKVANEEELKGVK